MSRAPTPEPTPTTDPNPDPTPTLDPDLSIHQNHTQPPGSEPLPLSANFAPRVRLDSACSGVSVASRAGPKDKGDMAPLSEQARLARRSKDRKKRKMKRQEQSANKRENKDPGQLADAKSQAEVAESQPVCSGEQTNKNNNNNPNTNPPTNPPNNPHTKPTPTSLRSPGEVYGEVNPGFTVTVSRLGAGEDANGQILRALLYAPEDYSVGRITQVTDGVTSELKRITHYVL